MRRWLLYLAFALCFWALQAACLTGLGAVEASHPSRLIVPNAQLAKLLVSDFDNLAADVLWLQVLQYNGEQLTIQDESKRDFQGVYPALDLATDFDPRFTEVATFGSWALSDGNRVDEARSLLMKGMRLHPSMWQYPFQLGFIEFLYGHRFLQAADDFAHAATLPDCPPGATHMAASLYARGNKLGLAIATWQAIYAHGDARMRGIARRALERLGASAPG